MDAIRSSKGKDERQKKKEDELLEYGEEVIDYEELYFKEILKQSEQYSILSSELDEKKTHEMGQLSYREFYATDYDRIDRIAYAFVVDDIDKSVFKPGVQVEFEGRRGERINGEIVEVDSSDKENIKIVVLFNTQISIDMFAEFGWISLSFSTVNKDVQLAANTKELADNKSPNVNNIFNKTYLNLCIETSCLKHCLLFHSLNFSYEEC